MAKTGPFAVLASLEDPIRTTQLQPRAGTPLPSLERVAADSLYVSPGQAALDQARIQHRRVVEEALPSLSADEAVTLPRHIVESPSDGSARKGQVLFMPDLALVRVGVSLVAQDVAGKVDNLVHAVFGRGAPSFAEEPTVEMLAVNPDRDGEDPTIEFTPVREDGPYSRVHLHEWIATLRASRAESRRDQSERSWVLHFHALQMKSPQVPAHRDGLPVTSDHLALEMEQVVETFDSVRRGFSQATIELLIRNLEVMADTLKECELAHTDARTATDVLVTQVATNRSLQKLLDHAAAAQNPLNLLGELQEKLHVQATALAAFSLVLRECSTILEKLEVQYIAEFRAIESVGNPKTLIALNSALGECKGLLKAFLRNGPMPLLEDLFFPENSEQLQLLLPCWQRIANNLAVLNGEERHDYRLERLLPRVRRYMDLESLNELFLYLQELIDPTAPVLHPHVPLMPREEVAGAPHTQAYIRYLYLNPAHATAELERRLTLTPSSRVGAEGNIGVQARFLYAYVLAHGSRPIPEDAHQLLLGWCLKRVEYRDLFRALLVNPSSFKYLPFVFRYDLPQGFDRFELIQEVLAHVSVPISQEILNELDVLLDHSQFAECVAAMRERLSLHS